MKTITTIGLLLVFLFTSCSHSMKKQHYNQLRNEINKEIIEKFEYYLPSSIDESIISTIRYAPNYNALGCSGIDVLYSFDSTSFELNIKKLNTDNIVPSTSFLDTLRFNEDNTEYLSLIDNNQKIAIPRLKEDFCSRTDNIYFNWKEIETIILQVDEDKVFSKNVEAEYLPKNPVCKYSIGAYISNQKKQIIYWLLIYN